MLQKPDFHVSKLNIEYLEKTILRSDDLQLPSTGDK